jgi:hypothetical protein
LSARYEMLESCGAWVENEIEMPRELSR